MLNNGFLLGIDPGSFKTGVAQVTPQGEVLNAEWVETKTYGSTEPALQRQRAAAGGNYRQWHQYAAGA